MAAVVCVVLFPARLADAQILWSGGDSSFWQVKDGVNIGAAANLLDSSGEVFDSGSEMVRSPLEVGTAAAMTNDARSVFHIARFLDGQSADKRAGSTWRAGWFLDRSDSTQLLDTISYPADVLTSTNCFLETFSAMESVPSSNVLIRIMDFRSNIAGMGGESLGTGPIVHPTCGAFTDPGSGTPLVNFSAIRDVRVTFPENGGAAPATGGVPQLAAIPANNAVGERKKSRPPPTDTDLEFQQIPEPSTAAFFGASLLFLIGRRRKPRRRTGFTSLDPLHLESLQRRPFV